MRHFFIISFLVALLSSCVGPSTSTTTGVDYLPTGTDLAVNLGLKHYDDLRRLRSGLISAGFQCGERAMSLNAAPILVLPQDFEKARVLAREIVIRDALTVRLWKSPGAHELEVWEHGNKTRDESYKFY
ncbi:MAG: hypothetical protein JWM68_632 [Verrucomicrobiales bacterium]|nr:hypothetical protein [Verrucomicrobiales bacterium]